MEISLINKEKSDPENSEPQWLFSSKSYQPKRSLCHKRKAVLGGNESEIIFDKIMRKAFLFIFIAIKWRLSEETTPTDISKQKYKQSKHLKQSNPCEKIEGNAKQQNIKSGLKNYSKDKIYEGGENWKHSR